MCTQKHNVTKLSRRHKTQDTATDLKSQVHAAPPKSRSIQVSSSATCALVSASIGSRLEPSWATASRSLGSAYGRVGTRTELRDGVTNARRRGGRRGGLGRVLALRTTSAQRSVAERAAAASTAAATSVAASQSRSSPRAGERASCDPSSRGVADRLHLGRPSRLRRAASLGLPEVALPSARKLSTCEAAAFSSEDGPGWRRRGAECRGAARGASADWVKNPQEIGNEEFQSRLTKHHVLAQSRCGRGGGAARAGGGGRARGGFAPPRRS